MEPNTITLDQAQKWATNWRKNPKNIVKAFLIPHLDISELLNLDGVVDVRTYVGIDEEGMHKLMLVGVDKTGADMIDDTNKQFIYDFTQPCPSTCDINSPLYTLKS